MKGTVKRVQKEKGFGFIKGEDGDEYFFHRSAVTFSFDEVRDGMKVEFEPDEGPKGLRAKDVERG